MDSIIGKYCLLTFVLLSLTLSVLAIRPTSDEAEFARISASLDVTSRELRRFGHISSLKSVDYQFNCGYNKCSE